MMPLLGKLSDKSKNIIIMGDFNANLINLNDDKNTSNFLDAMLSHSFLSFTTTATRITRNTKTLIDNIFYNKPLNDIMSGNLSSIISDHLIQFLIEPSQFTKKSPQMIYRQRCYKKFEKLEFRVDLIKINLSGVVFAMILIQILHLNIFLKLQKNYWISMFLIKIPI